MDTVDQSYYGIDDDFTKKVKRHVEKLFKYGILKIEIELSDGSWDTWSIESFLEFEYDMEGGNLKYSYYDAHVAIPPGQELEKNNCHEFNGSMNITDALKYRCIHENEVDVIITFTDNSFLKYEGLKKIWTFSRDITKDKDLIELTVKNITKIFRAFKWCGYEKMLLNEIHILIPTKKEPHKGIIIYKRKEKMIKN